MPGYFEQVVATALIKGGVIYTPAQIGVVLLPGGAQIVSSENHSASSDGPLTAGWSASAPGRTATFNIAVLFPGLIPVTATGLYIRHWSKLNDNTRGGSFSMTNTASNPGINTASLYVALQSETSQAGAGADVDQQFAYGIIPWTSGQPNLNLYVQWPNVNPALAGTFVRTDILGYTG